MLRAELKQSLSLGSIARGVVQSLDSVVPPRKLAVAHPHGTQRKYPVRMEVGDKSGAKQLPQPSELLKPPQIGRRFPHVRSALPATATKELVPQSEH